MNANEDRILSTNITHHHRQMHVAIDDVLESDSSKASIHRRQDSLDRALYQRLFADAVPDQISHRYHFEVMSFGKFLQLRQSRHRAVFIHDLADHTGGIKTGDARNVNARFGLSGAHEHSAFFRTQGKDVSGSG